MGEKVCEGVIQGEVDDWGKSPRHQDRWDTESWKVSTTVLVCQTGKVWSHRNNVGGSKVDAGAALAPSACCYVSHKLPQQFPLFRRSVMPDSLQPHGL